MLIGVPVVIHRRLMSPVSFVTNFFINLWKTKIIAVSNVVKEVLIEKNKFTKEKIKVIHNAIADSRFLYNKHKVELLSREFDKENNKIVLSVANLYPTKGFDDLIEVAKKLNSRIRNILFLIAGEGPEREKLEQKIRDYKLFNVVKLLGRRDDVIELLHICDCFVLLSFEEPFGGVFIEALGCGKPVIAYRAGGNPEIIEDKKVGFLLEPHDIDGVVEKVYNILTNKDLSLKLSENAKSYFKSKFSFDKMFYEIKSVYKELLE